MTKAQLYRLSGREFQLPLYVDSQGQVQCIPADNVPMLVWPNGRWCTQANLYMLELHGQGLSRKNSGGTLKTYGSNISHLIRFCYDHRIDFIELTDNQFTEFISKLTVEERIYEPGVKVRDANSVIAIGRNCLDFLFSVGRFHDDDGFIGLKGRIEARRKECAVFLEGRSEGKKIVGNYWHHHSFPTPDPQRSRLPISSVNVEMLRSVVAPCSATIYLRKRRYLMLKLLEITGARRSEIAALTLDSVRRAAKMLEPKLKLMTAKQPGGRKQYRLIPIARHDVVFLQQFISKNRRRVVRKTCGLKNDDGYVFVSETTGRKLQANTITQEIWTLAKASGIKEKVCPHMFRHAFITKLFVKLIEQHRFENADDFRRALLDTNGLKAVVQQWTGHRRISSLDVYIHLAFAEIDKLRKSLNVVRTSQVIESFRAGMVQVRNELRTDHVPMTEARQLLEQITEAFLGELDAISEGSSQDVG